MSQGLAPKLSLGHFRGIPTTQFLYVFFVYRFFFSLFGLCCASSLVYLTKVLSYMSVLDLFKLETEKPTDATSMIPGKWGRP